MIGLLPINGLIKDDFGGSRMSTAMTAAALLRKSRIWALVGGGPRLPALGEWLVVELFR